MMQFCYVYVLQSEKDHQLYTGLTIDLKTRLEEHNNGEVSQTQNRRPMKLIYYEACLSQNDAVKREKYLKTTWGKRYVNNRLESYFKRQI
ncbi:MAG: GIY-YIG nuclease superfamily protein [Planctomycetes bacterium ADurb.Bin401]|nr:MAG: GIY-YIG nuclease superfamily protein [Planctomycetes bacterium ADurb.Bin401]